MQPNSPEYIYLVSMAMKAAFADRNPSGGADTGGDGMALEV
jgi:hypothetical protein